METTEAMTRVSASRTIHRVLASPGDSVSGTVLEAWEMPEDPKERPLVRRFPSGGTFQTFGAELRSANGERMRLRAGGKSTLITALIKAVNDARVPRIKPGDHLTIVHIDGPEEYRATLQSA